MKKVLLGLIVLMIIGLSMAGSAANTYISGYAPWITPCDIQVYKLDSAGYKGDDTIGADYCNYYGPFALSKDRTSPMFKWFRCLVPKGTLNAVCSLKVEYQMLSGTTIADTGVSKFTSFDTIKAAAGCAGSVVKIDSLPGASIVFKLTATHYSGTAIISKPVKIIMYGRAVESPDTKH